MEKKQRPKVAQGESSRGNAEEDEDNESWVEVESLASLDSTGDPHPQHPAPIETEYAESASSAADSPDAADLYLTQNRQTSLAPRKRDLHEAKGQAKAETQSGEKAPRWWRIVKTAWEKVVESTRRVVHHARPLVQKVLKPIETPLQKPRKIVRWFMSNEGWNLVKCGSIAVVLLACVGMIVQNRTIHKALCWKQAW